MQLPSRVSTGGDTKCRADSASSERLSNEDVVKFRWIRAPVEVRMTHRLGPVPGDEVLPVLLRETFSGSRWAASAASSIPAGGLLSTPHSYTPSVGAE
jgi:hypothetical protein